MAIWKKEQLQTSMELAKFLLMPSKQRSLAITLKDGRTLYGRAEKFEIELKCTAPEKWLQRAEFRFHTDAAERRIDLDDIIGLSIL